MKRSPFLLLAIAIAAEGTLFLIYWGWAIWRGYGLLPLPVLSHWWWGFAAVLPLCFINGMLVVAVRRYPERFAKSSEFINEVVKPLADELGLFSALCVSIAAGVCEEVFFRGMLQTELGIIAANILFSLLHFGPAAWRYRLLVVLYFGLGCYFSWLVTYTGSLWPAIISHAVYDFIALGYMRIFFHGNRRGSLLANTLHVT